MIHTRNHVGSTAIRTTKWDDQTLEMTVWFKPGHGNSVYRYFGVPGHVFWGLPLGPGCGVWFMANIRMKYRYAKIV